MENTTRGPRGGLCPRCGRVTGGIKTHARFCEPDKAVDPDGVAVARAGAHAADTAALREAQKWRRGITDLDVTRVMYRLERGVRVSHVETTRGRIWEAPADTPLAGMGQRLSVIINEMRRTGLVRLYVNEQGDHLIPAKVHARNIEEPSLSACLFTGEDLGPIRSRLASNPALVDCPACERVVATGWVPQL